MKAAVVVFPGSNCDRDLKVALERAGADVTMVWHKESLLPENVDFVGIPGGFSFGDYLRCGAIAANSPICQSVMKHAERGGYCIGICNGFQVLTETRILPGALIRNAGLKFVARDIQLTVETNSSAFTSGYQLGQQVMFPVAHHDGNYRANDELIAQLRDQDRVAFRYVDTPNGSADDIAGVLSENRRVLGLMPHPERAVDALHGGTDGIQLFSSLIKELVSA